MSKLLSGVSLGAALALIAIIALTVAPDSPQDAQATHGATTPGVVDIVAIDADPFATTTNTGSALGPIEECIEVTVGDSFEIDVIIDSVDASTPMAGYGFDVLFDPTVIQLGLDDDGDNAARTSDATDNDGDGKTDEPGEGYDEDPPENAPPFAVDNDGDTLVDEDGISHTHLKLSTATDFSVLPQQNDPALAGGGGDYRVDGGAFSGFQSGEGTVVRIPVKAVGFGTSILDLNDIAGGDGVPDIFDFSATLQTVNNVGDALIAVGVPCAGAITDVEVTSVTTTADPNGTVGNPFAVTVNATVVNNGPITPVDTTVTVTLNPVPPQGSECTAAGGNQASPIPMAALAASTAIPQQTFSVTCDGPSFHEFTATVAITLDDPALAEPDTDNNTLTSSASTTEVTADTDLEVQSVTVSGPADPPLVAVPFGVTATVTLVNLGPFTPVLADMTVNLTLPADCTTVAVNPRTVQDTSLTAFLATEVPVTWPDVTCTDISDHTFAADASVVPDNVHVIDTGGTNNGASGDTTFGVFEPTDVKVTDVIVTGPSDASIDTPFDVTVSVTRLNDGPVDPVSTDTEVLLALPDDCTPKGITSDQLTNVSLAISVDSTAEAVFSVSCSLPSAHSFTADATISISSAGVGDSDTSNNSGSGDATVAVTADADLEVVSTSITVGAPASAGEAFDVAVESSVRNNGPFGPVNADVTVSLEIPAGCTADPDGDQVEEDLTLEVSETATDLPTKTWSLTCSSDPTGTFKATVSIVAADLHVIDPDEANNTSTAEAAALASTAGPTTLPSTGATPLGVDGTSWLVILAAVAGLAVLSGVLFVAARRFRGPLS